MRELSETESESIFSFGPAKVLTGVALFFALVHAEFSLVLPAAGILLLGFGTSLWARFAASRLELDLKSGNDRVFPGESIELEIELRNQKFLPVWVTLEIPSPRHLEFEAGDGEQPSLMQSGLRLLSREKARRSLRLRAKQRGAAQLGPARISAGDLLGLSVRTKKYAMRREIIVFPRRLWLKELHVPFQEYFGMHAARGPVEDPAWYAGTRDYTGTRPAKNIHWKASARLGVLQEKLYEPTLHRKMLFILDVEGYESPDAAGGFERMIETLGTLAAALMETGASFGFVTNACLENSRQRILPAGRGPEHLGNLLEILARVCEGKAACGLGEICGEAARGYVGFVYCGAAAGDNARLLFRESSGSKKMFFVFTSADTQGFNSWEGCPACRAEDICMVPGDAE
jgi:uncharacterized protein (DUF58 family)